MTSIGHRYAICCESFSTTIPIRQQSSIYDEFLDLPILVGAIGQVPPDDEGDRLLVELLFGDNERVDGHGRRVGGFSESHCDILVDSVRRRVHGDRDGCVQADLERARADDPGLLVLGHVRTGDPVRVLDLYDYVQLANATYVLPVFAGVRDDVDVGHALMVVLVELIVLLFLLRELVNSEVVSEIVTVSVCHFAAPVLDVCDSGSAKGRRRATTRRLLMHTGE
ncbi:hypothetical protein BOVATA_033230 [Babesia ovata]|uniref:Uncharacterized protein n=1 Tax=Babesia ovata TaxID=189622 RepID=A0A2H6KFR3_9APIC|nr:uncharacterized protein BOVATA_033230 [Babesia ovata]GBE61830.1 hypothetical protein BOVATA_033230 [Babesia ovata]